MKYCLIKSLSLAFAMLSIPIMAQQKTVTGTVTDEKGLPLIGVNVVVPETRQGTATDFDGKYTIVVSPGQSLKFTYIGYQTQVVQVINATTVLNVSLTPAETELGEVVVVGYGERNKAELSSAISQVDVKKTLEQTNFTNVAEALSGSVAGISVSAGSGQPGSGTFDIIRGVGSINSDSRPLYVINGVPIVNDDVTRSLTDDSGPLAGLDPNTVQSVTILKDASATAIYGARGANGVILITTKSGAYNQKARVSFRSEYSLGDIAFDKFKPLNAEQWIMRYAIGNVNAGKAPNLDVAREQLIAGFKKEGWDGKRSTDWKRYTTRDKAVVISNHVDVSGGAEKTKYNLGLGAYSNKGLQLNSGFNRYALNLSLTHRYSDQLSFGTRINLASASQKSIVQGSARTNPISSRYFYPPVYSPYNKDGSYNTDIGKYTHYNPVAMLKFNRNAFKELFLNGNIFAQYRFLNMFQFRSTFSANYVQYDEDDFSNPFYGDGTRYKGEGEAFYVGVLNWDWSNVLQFRRRFGIHNFNMDLGTNITTRRYRNIFAIAYDYTFPLLPDLASASKPFGASSTRKLAHFRSYFTRLTYTLQDKYSLTGTYRRDGSSRFGPNKKFGNFWAISGAWNLNRENFIGDFFNDLKLRTSYGTVGNAEIENFAYLSKTASAPYDRESGLVLHDIGVSDLSWESKREFDVGLDLAVFSKRLRLVFDYYSARNYNLLLDLPVSLTTGFGSQLQNSGELVNRGFEFNLSGYPIRKRDFLWNVGAVLSINHNEVTDLGRLSFLSGVTFKDRKAPAVGKPLGSWYMRGWAGVDRDTGGPLWYTDSTETKTTADYNKANLYFQGNSIPRYIGGLTNTLQYKSLSLYALFDYKGGYKVYQGWGSYTDTDGGQLLSGGREGAFKDRWTKEHRDAKYPKYVAGGRGVISDSDNPSSRYLYDGDFIRLRSIQLAYALPERIVKSLKLTSFTLYVKGNNLWTYAFDKDLYFDPECGNNQVANENLKEHKQWKGSGYYNFTQPIMKYYGMGFNITF